MKHAFLTRAAAACLGMAVLLGGAQAQSDLCAEYRAELRNLERGGGQNYADLAEQQRSELNRMVNYYQQLDCDRARTLFDAPPSQDCAAARDRIDAMEENYNRLLRQASQASEDRRQQLLAAIDRHCRPQQARRGFLDGLFGRGDQGTDPGFDPRDDFPVIDDSFARRAGAEPICVRTCDGFFFPLFARGASTDEAEQLCQAQCPNAPTRLFYMAGDSELETAIAADGTPYTALPNAFRYRTTFDPSCSCRREEESWAEALSGAERLLGQGRGDIIVDTQLARELSLPAELREAVRAERRESTAAGDAFPSDARIGGAVDADPDLARRTADEASGASPSASREPTWSDDSAGIRIDGLESERVLSREEGRMGDREDTGFVPSDRGPVRIVAPDLVPPPNPM